MSSTLTDVSLAIAESRHDPAWTPDPGPRTPAEEEPDTNDLGPPIPELTEARRDALQRLVQGVGMETALLAIHGDPSAVRAAIKANKAKWLAIAMGGRSKERREQIKAIAAAPPAPQE